MNASEKTPPPGCDSRVPFTARVLGWGGLLPFIALALGMLLLPGIAAAAANLLSHYAFGILCFLLGTWWGIGVMRPDPAPLVWSNAVFIALFLARAMLHGAPFMVVAALLFVVLLLVERRLPAFSRQPAYYATLRARLSLVAAASLLLGAWQYP
jgi:hypothetical protein